MPTNISKNVESELEEDIRKKFEELEIDNPEESYFIERVKEIVDISKIQYWIILNASESDPNQYEEDAIDLHIITKEDLVVIEYSGSKEIEYTYWNFEKFGTIFIDRNKQRLSGVAHANVGTGQRVLFATYDTSEYEELQRYISKLRDQINDR